MTEVGVLLRAVGGWFVELRARVLGTVPAGPPVECVEFQADPSLLEPEVVAWPLDHLRDQGMALVRAFIQEAAQPFDPRRLSRGLAMLESVVAQDPDDAAAHWCLGLGYRRTRSYRRSFEALGRAWALSPDDQDAAREFVLGCLFVGRAGDAVPVARALADEAEDPLDAGSNLALSLLLHGDVEGAHREIAAAARKAPDHPLVKRLRVLIDAVRSGRRKRPNSILDLRGERDSAQAAVGLTPEDARAAWREATTAYRAALQTSEAHVLSPDERDRMEAEIGPILYVTIDISDADISWHGRALWGTATEHATFVGTRGGMTGSRAVSLGVEERSGGWRVVRVWSLPGIAPTQGGGVFAEDTAAASGFSDTLH